MFYANKLNCFKFWYQIFQNFNEHIYKLAYERVEIDASSTYYSNFIAFHPSIFLILFLYFHMHTQVELKPVTLLWLIYSNYIAYRYQLSILFHTSGSEKNHIPLFC